jgi:hypothetical protein
MLAALSSANFRPLLSISLARHCQKRQMERSNIEKSKMKRSIQDNAKNDNN